VAPVTVAGVTSAVLPTAVLWDLDGTLVDTEPSWIEAEYALVGRHGGQWSDEHAHALVGNPLMVSAEYLIEHGGVDLPADEIVQILSDHVTARIRFGAPWRPGAIALLEELRALGVPQALVTMSWLPMAQAVVDQLPPGVFGSVVTGDRVRHGKPHPEPYLTALAELGVGAAGAVAIEDSPTGLASAEAAGVQTIAVPHVVAVPLREGRRVVQSLEALGPYDLRTPVSKP
jgi:HAD superfamily hydrolase (TIGR01509 family)